MKDSLVQQCLDILKRDDIKNEFKLLFKPVIDFILYEINPYIYITVALVFMIFVMILAILVILIILLRNKSILQKIF
jgi:hypothetical protein|uniref:Uncharacterized protein n=1 Tax=viral metagenome TaxID=1070528 RepID=A0A6C0IET7_9ZZZZ